MTAANRDGFVIYDTEGVEQHFTPCDKNGNMRDKVWEGLIRRCREDWFVSDTRDDVEP